MMREEREAYCVNRKDISWCRVTMLCYNRSTKEEPLSTRSGSDSGSEAGLQHLGTKGAPQRSSTGG